MLKPVGPKIDTNGNGETVKRDKMVKLENAKIGKMVKPAGGEMVKMLNRQGRKLARMVKLTSALKWLNW